MPGSHAAARRHHVQVNGHETPMSADLENGNGQQLFHRGIVSGDPFSRHEKCRRDVMGDQEVDQVVINTRRIPDRTEVDTSVPRPDRSRGLIE